MIKTAQELPGLSALTKNLALSNRRSQKANSYSLAFTFSSFTAPLVKVNFQASFGALFFALLLEMAWQTSRKYHI